MTVALTVAAYHAATMSSPVPPSRLHLAFQGLRLRLRGSDLWFIALALLVGLIAGYLTLLQSGIARWLQGTLYGLDDGMRLSSLPSLTGPRYWCCHWAGCWSAWSAWRRRD